MEWKFTLLSWAVPVFFEYHCRREPIKVWIMTTVALNNLLTYLQGLSLARNEREWLAGKLIEPVSFSAEVEQVETETLAVTGKQHKMRELSPEIEYLSNLNLRAFTKEELDEDPLLAAIVEDRRLRE